MEVESLFAEDVVAEDVCGVCFVDRSLEDALDLGVFVAEINEAALSAGGVGGEDHALDEGVGIVFHDGTVLEATGFTFVGITDNGFGIARCVGDGLPFHAGGESCAATAGEFGFGDEIDEGGGSGGYGRLESPIAAGSLVAREGVAFGGTDVAEDALVDVAGIGRGKRGWAMLEGFGGCADEDLIATEDGNHVVASAGAGHRRGAFRFEGFEDFLAAVQAADVAGANARRGFAGFGSGKVVVEGDRGKEFGERDSEALTDDADGVIGEVAIAVVDGVEDGQEGGILIPPLCDDFLIGHWVQYRCVTARKPSRKTGY